MVGSRVVTCNLSCDRGGRGVGEGPSRRLSLCAVCATQATATAMPSQEVSSQGSCLRVVWAHWALTNGGTREAGNGAANTRRFLK